MIPKQQLRLFVDRTVNDRYKITSELGQGGMGTVYEAIDLTTNRPVAIKQLRAPDRDLRAAFAREGKLLRTLNYLHIPHVIDEFQDETGMFMAMQFISGPNLGQLLASRQLPFTPSQVRLWAKDLLQTIAYIHNQTPAILHRDIKPGNLKLLPDNSIVLLDFGLATQLGDSDQLADNAVLGYTPNYAPPEQIRGEPSGHYSDLYSLGATLYHLVTGVAPVDSVKRASQIRSSGYDPLPPIAQLVRGVPQALALLINKCLSLDPRMRPQSAGEMIEYLNNNTLVPSFKSEVTVQAKPNVVSRKREEQINTPTDYRHARVVPLSAYRNQKTREVSREVTRAVNLASAVISLSLVAWLSVYVWLQMVSPRYDNTDNSSAVVGTASSVVRPAPPSSSPDTRPRQINMDELVRNRIRFQKKKRLPPVTEARFDGENIKSLAGAKPLSRNEKSPPA
jgi:serine/threonine protein kinase